MSEMLQAVIIGSGFGGAINACRLSKKWPGEVLVLERGKRYPMGSFPRTPHAFARNFWNLPEENRKRVHETMEQDEEHGMFDIRNYEHLNVVLGAGLGGGSLIYANVFLEPPEEVFDERWPQQLDRDSLRPYYDVAKEVLGSRPIPQNGDPRRKIVRTELFQQVAEETGRKSELVDINVFFGNDFEKPLAIGEQAKNRYGALQTSCVYCAECDVGCNTHSKNTLDLNYLFVAEHDHGAVIKTEHQGEKVVPLDADGQDDPSADGSHGYRLTYRNLQDGSEHSVTTQRVVVSAGTLGSTEFLLRCRDVHKTLPAINDRLGDGFSANGDFLSFVLDGERPADPNYGPVITQRTDFNLFEDFDRDRAFILEDASYPSWTAWFVEGVRPAVTRLGSVWQLIKDKIRRLFRGDSKGSVDWAFSDLLKGDVSYDTSVLLCMGLDRSDGTMSLDRQGYMDIDWPYKNSLPLYEAILDAGKAFDQKVGGKAFFPLPTWYEPLRKNVSVHPLGGCRLADDPADGVTSAARDTFGQVYGYQGLYVADGAIVPTAVGANPTATISALSELVAEGITGIAPTAELR